MLNSSPARTVPFSEAPEGGPAPLKTAADKAAWILARLAHTPDRPLDTKERPELSDLAGVDLSRDTLLQRGLSAETPPAWWSPESQGVRWTDAALAGVTLRSAKLRGVDLQRADLQNAVMGMADLSDGLLEKANLEGADLAGTKLCRANLGGARLGNALLEEADLTGCCLRFANLRSCFLDHARLPGADLWGAHLEGASLLAANLEQAVLREAHLEGADLSGAVLRDAELDHARLAGATLRNADLQRANLQGADLSGANLQGAHLQGLDLTTCNIHSVRWAGARLDKTHLHREQLGDVIGEELAHEYESARLSYVALERNFRDLGDADAASWAYLRKRRMQKRAAAVRARSAWKKRHWRKALSSFLSYVGDQVVECICDYGESIPRVLLSLLMVYLLFTVLYGVTGSLLTRQVTPGGQEVMAVTRHPVDLAIFSLMAMTTSGSPVVGLQPSSVFVHAFTGVQALIGIFLTGLLGFVAGNRIRR